MKPNFRGRSSLLFKLVVGRCGHNDYKFLFFRLDRYHVLETGERFCGCHLCVLERIFHILRNYFKLSLNANGDSFEFLRDQIS